MEIHTRGHKVHSTGRSGGRRRVAGERRHLSVRTPPVISPVGLVAGETRRALGHALPRVDDKVKVAGQVHAGAKVHGDAAPALKLVRVRGAAGHAAVLVEVVLAGRTRHVVVWLRAAAQALAVATLA